MTLNTYAWLPLAVVTYAWLALAVVAAVMYALPFGTAGTTQWQAWVYGSPQSSSWS